MLALTMLLSTLSLSVPAFAAGNTFGSATAMSFNRKYSGTLSENDKVEYFKFTLSESAEVSFTCLSYISDSRMTVYDEEMTEIYNTNLDGNTNTGSTFSVKIDLVSGTYIVKIYSYYHTGKYELTAKYKSAGESFKESLSVNNDDFDFANLISFNQAYKAQIAKNDKSDYYKFTLPTSGKIDINAKSDMYMRINLYNANKNYIDHDYLESGNNNYSYYLNSGTYYLFFNQELYTGNYSFKISFLSSGETFKETQTVNNDSFATANAISLNKSYKGVLVYEEDNDFYKLVLSSPKNINIRIIANNSLKLYVYNSSGKTVENFGGTLYTRNDTNSVDYTERIFLNAGTYYIGVIKNYNSENYSLSVTEIVKAKSVATLKAAKLKKLKKGKKRFTAKWKAVRGASGYVVQYSLKKNMKGTKTKIVSKTKATVKKLQSKKRYYVRVRAYVTVNGKKYYGKWSKTRSVKTK